MILKSLSLHDCSPFNPSVKHAFIHSLGILCEVVATRISSAWRVCLTHSSRESSSGDLSEEKVVWSAEKHNKRFQLGASGQAGR